MEYIIEKIAKQNGVGKEEIIRDMQELPRCHRR